MDLLSFSQWDAIADSYIPLLSALVSIHLLHLFVTKSASSKTLLWKSNRLLFIHMVTISIAIAWVYGLMFLDAYLNIWPSLSINDQVLDYSTHTALALVFSSYLYSIYRKKKPGCAYTCVVSMVLYLLLMKYQKYHSFADIISTVLVILPVIFLLFKRLNKHQYSLN